jgi:SNF2 family DNA or RNA helicase
MASEIKTFTPHSYQQGAIDFLENVKKSAMWLPMGAGKTSCTLSHINYLKNKFKGSTVLIVAPLSVVELTWAQECAKWEQFKDTTIATLHGTNKEKVYLESRPDIFLINYEGLAWLEKCIIKHKLLKFNAIIFDESSKLKSWSTTRFKICKGLCKLVKRVVLLSATPSPNNYLDLWSQYYLLDKGERLGKTISAFKARFFYEVGYNFKEYKIRPECKELIPKLVADITYRIDEAELPSIPELSLNKINVKLTKKLKKKYESLEKDMFYELDSSKDEGIEAFNAASLTGKCRQFVQGFLYHDLVDDLPREVEKIHTLKLDVLKDFVEGMNGEPLLIAYTFRYEYEMLKSALGEDVPHLGSGTPSAKMKEYEKLWNSKELPIMLCNPASVSHGLNLQKGGHNILWYSLTYSWEQYTQLIGRLHRQGQRNEVRNHILLMEDTIDVAVFNKLQAKEQGQRAFLDAIYQYQKTKESGN